MKKIILSIMAMFIMVIGAQAKGITGPSTITFAKTLACKSVGYSMKDSNGTWGDTVILNEIEQTVTIYEVADEGKSIGTDKYFKFQFVTKSDNISYISKDGKTSELTGKEVLESVNGDQRTYYTRLIWNVEQDFMSIQQCSIRY